jgi:hypothetical protein
MKRIRALEREVARKEKALAEAAACSTSRPATDTGTLVEQDSKLDTRRHSNTQSRPFSGEDRCGILMSATTTLTLTAGLNCYRCSRSAEST